MARYVLDTNNKWLVAVSDRTFKVMSPGVDLNTHNPPTTVEQWKEVARVGSNAASNHRELEVWGVVFSGKKLEDLSAEIINHQLFVNREGFMCMYFNVGAPNMYLNHNGQKSLVRRLNDLFDWSKYGVNVPLPLETVWDRFQLNNGKLMVDNKAAGEKQKENQKQLEEKEKENEKLKQELEAEKKKSEEEQKKKDEEIEKQKKELEQKNKELEDAKKANEEKDKEIGDLKAKQAADAEELKKLRQDLADRDKRIDSLKAALRAFL